VAAALQAPNQTHHKENTMSLRTPFVSPAAVLCLSLTACGGDGSSTPTAPSVVTAPAAPCTQSTLLQGSGSLPSRFVGVDPISVNTSGRVDIILDWTFASSAIGVYLVQGACPLDQFNARSCNFLIRSESGAKPRKVSASNVAAGSYSVLVANAGSEAEALSIQVFLASATCAPIAAAVSGSHAGGLNVDRQAIGIFGR
jgi:hypothetical protein